MSAMTTRILDRTRQNNAVPVPTQSQLRIRALNDRLRWSAAVARAKSAQSKS